MLILFCSSKAALSSKMIKIRPMYLIKDFMIWFTMVLPHYLGNSLGLLIAQPRMSSKPLLKAIWVMDVAPVTCSGFPTSGRTSRRVRSCSNISLSPLLAAIHRRLGEPLKMTPGSLLLKRKDSIGLM